MAKQRLNDTVALTTRPLEGNECRTISTEKVGMGYVVTETYSNSSTGEYRCKKSLTGVPPRITGPDNDGGLKGAMTYLNDDK
jgi:hypothetical protein